MATRLPAVVMEATPTAAVPRHVRQALSYLRANVREKVTLAELAAASGISQRALLKQFKQFLGVSPIAHLRRMRLAAARGDLQREGEDSVADIALRHGFAHVGRFATEYHKSFGERPSATRQRARGAAVLPLPSVAPPLPSLFILPLRTETLPERRLAQEWAEQVAAILSRIRVATVTFADPAIVLPRRLAWSPKERGTTRYCLHGRLVQREDRVRVTLWLTDTEGRHVWGDSYDGHMGDLFDLQRRVADGALLGVVPGISGAEIERIRTKDPRTLATRERLLRAFPMWLKIDAGSSREMLAVATHAMELAPDDALPFAVAAHCQARLFNEVATESPAATRETATQLACRADALDAGDPLVVTARAAVATLTRSYDEAESLVERALAMDPTSAWAHERAGYVSLRDDPEAAIARFDRAIRLHGPFMPRDNCFHGMGLAHDLAGRLEDAVRWERRAVAENPRAAPSYRNLICLDDRLGLASDVRKLAAQLCRLCPETRVSRLRETHPQYPFEGLERAGVPL